MLLFALLPLFADATPKIYHKGWIDFNKNGKMDVYENPKAKVEDRIEDLLSQMTLDEKTCQMVTLYGYRRVFKSRCQLQVTGIVARLLVTIPVIFLLFE